MCVASKTERWKMCFEWLCSQLGDSSLLTLLCLCKCIDSQSMTAMYSIADHLKPLSTQSSEDVVMYNKELVGLTV